MTFMVAGPDLNSPKISMAYQYDTEFLCVVQMCNCFSLDALSCSMANCQYGCDVVKGEIHCRCPSPSLQLGPDGRTCIGELLDTVTDFTAFFRMFSS